MAFGEIYWDDGDSLDTFENGDFTHIKFQCNSTEFTSVIVQNSSLLPIPKMHTVIVAGVKDDIKFVTVNGKKSQNFMLDTDSQILKIENLKVDLTENIIVKWE